MTMEQYGKAPMYRWFSHFNANFCGIAQLAIFGDTGKIDHGQKRPQGDLWFLHHPGGKGPTEGAIVGKFEEDRLQSKTQHGLLLHPQASTLLRQPKGWPLNVSCYSCWKKWSLCLKDSQPGNHGCSKNPNVSLVLVKFSYLLHSPHLTCTYYVEIAFGIVILSTLWNFGMFLDRLGHVSSIFLWFHSVTYPSDFVSKWGLFFLRLWPCTPSRAASTAWVTARSPSCWI